MLKKLYLEGSLKLAELVLNTGDFVAAVIEARKDQVMKVVVLSALMIMAIVPEAFCVTAPAAGSFAYDIYDLGVNQILKGPIGFVGGCGCVGFGGYCAVKQNVGAALGCILGGAAMLKADSITTSMGLIY